MTAPAQARRAPPARLAARRARRPAPRRMAAGPASARPPRRDRTVSGDVDQGRRACCGAGARSTTRARCSPISRSAPRHGRGQVALAAELAFQSGDYAGAIRQLDKLPDTAVDGAGRPRPASWRRARSPSPRRSSRCGRPRGTHDPARARPDAAIAGLAGEVLDGAWEAIGDDLGLRPAGAIRVELAGRAGGAGEAVAADRDGHRDDRDDRPVEVQQADGRLAARDDLRLPVDGHARPRYTHLLVVAAARTTPCRCGCREGLARFEQTRWRTAARAAAVGHRAGAARHPRSRRADSSRSSEMHPSMAKLPSQDGRGARAYAEVYTLVAWLHGKLGYKGIRERCAAQRDGKSARRAVAEALAMTWAAVERGLARASGRSPPRPTAARRQADPVRQGRRRCRRTSGSSRWARRARKHARLGGILRVAPDARAAAVEEYERALTIGGPSRSSPAKLARTLGRARARGPAPAAASFTAPPAPQDADRSRDRLATPLAAPTPTPRSR